MKVFFAGSRSISRLNAEIRQRIDAFLREGANVLVGDANGADKAFQQHLLEKQYRQATVFCSGSACRNNLGDWPTECVPSDRKKKDFEHYALKDTRMAAQADGGLFLWDAKSKGTLNNIVSLVARGKSVDVYLAPKQTFVTLKDISGLRDVVGQCGSQTLRTLQSLLIGVDDAAASQSQFDFA
ncbi:MAG: hypothetical protein HYS13_12910 [Planctomycetia bacterium]|nr:hypothetical protein [Planctomycetia bacterium]